MNLLFLAAAFWLPALPARLFFCGGERGIRTPGTHKGSTVFETAPFNHSGISPFKMPGKGTDSFYFFEKNLNWKNSI